MSAPVLKIDELVTEFTIRGQKVPAVRGVSLEVKKGKTLVVLGESGSGKSVMLRSIMRVLPRGAHLSGSITYNGDNVLDKSEAEMRRLRGNWISMVFQDSLSAMDPLFRVGEQVGENIREHRRFPKTTIRDQVIRLFGEVGIPSPAARTRSYPHEMSGGMRQRSVIAMALSNTPDILLADEPTTALDVTIQAQILSLFKQIQREYGMTMILVTHDIGVAVEMADEIAVMYAGKVVEYGDAKQVLGAPAHPYTQGLIAATPQKGKRGRLQVIPGQPPAITAMPGGCAFASRCRYATERCRKEMPPHTQLAGGHMTACYKTEDGQALAQLVRQ
ncbi:ABC transporter ATP-binding protein [Paenibacillus sp. IB182496]|uniref:ABC transporter ATP-binding protein n=1 Tax=Paenibacillus sabuli TaxID=2772509 RepID=A0A927GTT7_9BACL|nr:ABC transporter ATP-binding protein [Paenibacillus sabuli]MBD2847037.1 ABC transporter ATP-binding protein [Paenibacillus sabuli]